MNRIGAFRLDDKFADVKQRIGTDRAKHLGEPAVVEPMVLGFRRWDRYEGQAVECLLVQRSSKCVCGRSNCPFLVPPFWASAAVNWLLEIEDQVVGRAVGKSLTCRVFTEEVADVILGQIPVVRPCQIVDLSEATGKDVTEPRRSL